MNARFDISKADKVVVLQKLYGAARPQGLGILHYKQGELSREDAEKVLGQTKYFDYLQGRVMKVNLGEDVMSARLYDRDNGPGAAGRALAGVPGVVELAEDAA